ncbi:hypothetical protein SARC_09653 [Sphaeroforma arctica JP610]|uniref:GH18 domain-containing protein n=1 Tax=Sphaeroforma arctica JP610 TaxID=667725 RepID=A0A0L0FN19_9EUKA|nr:hypothetical protein SARC_09653 [Sphaeroforma arctica JP610]KNC77896.1 hypothetical protein SARC_09653 [Sphaeroforma arctica JP610]|eukprot:XP_014151798.1 hypothetical protein SARC_09653 [Sphaeroforma arctica JP610]
MSIWCLSKLSTATMLFSLLLLHISCVFAYSTARNEPQYDINARDASTIASDPKFDICQSCPNGCMAISAYTAGVPGCHAWLREFCIGQGSEFAWCEDGRSDTIVFESQASTAPLSSESTAPIDSLALSQASPTNKVDVEICSELPSKVVGMYILLADDSDPIYTSAHIWQPRLHEYQQLGANVLFFTFIEPISMEVPQSFINLAVTRGDGALGSVPSTSKIIFAIGGQAYSMDRQWPWLTSNEKAKAMAYTVSTWIENGWCDGIDLDLESGPQANDATAVAAMIAFVAQLKKLVPSIIVTQPVMGTAGAVAVNDRIVEAAFTATSPLLGIIDAVGVMVYETTNSLDYTDNYEKGCDSSKCSQWWCPLNACVPRDNIIAGLKGTSTVSDLIVMTNETVYNVDGYRGVMVWYASVIDQSTQETALQYDVSWDASAANTDTKSAWKDLLESAGVPASVDCTSPDIERARARRQTPLSSPVSAAPSASLSSYNQSVVAPNVEDQNLNPESQVLNSYQGVYIKTWEGGWTAEGIRAQYGHLYGVADIAFLTFFKPIPGGLECDEAMSMCASVWDSTVGLYGEEVSATEVYRNASIAAKNTTGMRTLLAIGGWSFRDDFAFLATLTAAQIRQWALNVKQTVDLFGADGVDIDYEAESSQQWEDEIVKTNMLGLLREVMPTSEGYVIMLTIAGLAGVQGPAQAVSDFFSPSLTLTYETGKAVSTIVQNHKDLDMLQLMTYDGEPNLNPMYCMELTRQTTQRLLGEGISHKIAMGVELGPQVGNCESITEGWCTHDMASVLQMADFVSRNKYGGIFYWSNVPVTEADEYYNATMPFFEV